MWRIAKPYLLLLPALLAVTALFYAGLFQALQQSLGYDALSGESAFTLKYYQWLLSDVDFWRSTWLTLRVALISTLIAAVVGTALAIALFEVGRRSGISQRGRFVYLLPLLFPHLTAAYIVLLWLMQSGLLARIAYLFGLISEPAQFPLLVQESFGWGIIITYVWKEVPFFVLMLTPVLLRMDTRWIEVSRVLGAGYLQYVRTIVLPLLWPAIAVSSLIVFAFSCSAYEVPYLLGVTYPQTIPVEMMEMYLGELSDRPLVMATSMLLVAGIGAISLIVFLLVRKTVLGSGRGWL